MDSKFASFFSVIENVVVRLTPPSTAKIYVEQRNKFWGALVGVVAIEQATLDRERNVAFAKWNEGIVACNVKENIKSSL